MASSVPRERYQVNRFAQRLILDLIAGDIVLLYNRSLLGAS
jgi:hypothetical protein